MLHDYPQSSKSTRVTQEAWSALHHLFHEKREGLKSAAILLAGARGGRLVDDLSMRLADDRELSRSALHLAGNLLDVLALEFVHDFEREEAMLFAQIEPGDPRVDEICLLTEELHEAIDHAGLDHPRASRLRHVA